MNHRSHLSQSERMARAKLAQIIHQKPFLCGSVVNMRRKCGKSSCKCRRGQRHQSLYLVISVEGKRKMFHVPRIMESTVRQWVSNYKEIWEFMEKVSESCLRRFLLEKSQSKRREP